MSLHETESILEASLEDVPSWKTAKKIQQNFAEFNTILLNLSLRYGTMSVRPSRISPDFAFIHHRIEETKP